MLYNTSLMAPAPRRIPLPIQKSSLVSHQLACAASLPAASSLHPITSEGPSSNSLSTSAMTTSHNAKHLINSSMEADLLHCSSTTGSTKTVLDTPSLTPTKPRSSIQKMSRRKPTRPSSYTGASSSSSNDSSPSLSAKVTPPPKARKSSRGRRKSPNSNLPCGICNQMYSRKDNLRVHQRVHSGEKPYQCKYCSVYFRWLGALRAHEAWHVRQDDTLPHDDTVVEESSSDGEKKSDDMVKHAVNDDGMEKMFDYAETEYGPIIAKSVTGENLLQEMQETVMSDVATMTEETPAETPVETHVDRSCIAQRGEPSVFENGEMVSAEAPITYESEQTFEGARSGVDVVVTDADVSGNLLFSDFPTISPVVLDDMVLSADLGWASAQCRYAMTTSRQWSTDLLCENVNTSGYFRGTY